MYPGHSDDSMLYAVLHSRWLSACPQKESATASVCFCVRKKRKQQIDTNLAAKKKIVYTKINPFYKTSIKPLTGEMHRHVCAHSAYLVHATS